MVPASSYNMQDDNRLLIPFTSGDKIGFVDKEGAIVVKPQFTMYYGDCYDESDNIRVSVDCLYGFIRSGGRVATYKRPMYGLIDYKGETIFEPSFIVWYQLLETRIYILSKTIIWICCFKHRWNRSRSLW